MSKIIVIAIIMCIIVIGYLLKKYLEKNSIFDLAVWGFIVGSCLLILAWFNYARRMDKIW